MMYQCSAIVALRKEPQMPVGMTLGGYSIVPFLLLVIVPGLLGLWAQIRVKSAFARASKIPASSGLTGAQVAKEILRAFNINDVGIEVSHGMLSDHYDPKAKMLRLSEKVYGGRSVAAAGIAAHEVGHAIQHATRYGPLSLRSAIVPMAVVGSNVANIAIMAGVLLMAFMSAKMGATILLVGILGLCAVAFFQLITLPVEFDASRRAKDLLQSSGLVAAGPEAQAMNSVLNAAALTYVAALVATVGTILYYLLILTQRRD
jgi:Zn-dependent membrane protease YugP